MLRKVRELKKDLRAAGFDVRSGKGSHTVWYHSALDRNVVLSGHDGDDAEPYQERDVRRAIQAVRDRQ